MTSILNLNDNNAFLKYCDDPVYKLIIEAYIQFLEENTENNTFSTGKTIYDFLYPESSYNPVKRLMLAKNNGTMNCIESIASDFGVNINYVFEAPFVLGESELNASDFLSENFFTRCINNRNSCIRKQV